jgi:RHS repeat-associated protein
MVGDNMQEMQKAVGALLRWLALSLLFAGTHAFAQTGGTVTYVYTDPQGTPLAEADVSGNITATFEYTPYGTYAPQGTSSPGPAPEGPGYTGHVNDPETNLVYMQARYYDPATGHFLSVDPLAPTVGNVFEFNRFSYVNNNPINHIDPNGRCIEDACVGEGILVGELVEWGVSAYEASTAAEAATAASATATATTTTASVTATSGTVTASEAAAACAKKCHLCSRSCDRYKAHYGQSDSANSKYFHDPACRGAHKKCEAQHER